MGGQFERVWSSPIVVKAETGLAAGDGQWQGLVQAAGHYNCFDVFMGVPGAGLGADNPAAWMGLTAGNPVLGDVQVRVRAQLGGVSAILARKSVRDLQITSAAQGTVNPLTPNAPFSGLLFSIRGRACDHLYVEARSLTVQGVSAPKLRATWALRAWGGPEGVYGDDATQLPVAPYAERHKYWHTTIQFTAGNLDQEAHAAIPDDGTAGRRIYVAELNASSNSNQARVLSLADVNAPLGSDVDVWQGVIGDMVSVVSESFTAPIRSERGSSFRIRLSAIGGGNPLFFVNVGGFIE